MKYIRRIALCISILILLAGITTSTYAWLTLDSIDAELTINSGRTSLDTQVFYDNGTNWELTNEETSIEMSQFDYSLSSTTNTQINLLFKVGNTSEFSGSLFFAISDNGNTSCLTSYKINVAEVAYVPTSIMQSDLTYISYNDIPTRTDSFSYQPLEFDEYTSLLDIQIDKNEYKYLYITIDYNEDSFDEVLDFYSKDNSLFESKNLNLDLRFDTYIKE